MVHPTAPLCNESGVRESLGVHPPREFSICSVGVATVLPIALLLKHNLLYEVVVIYLAAYIWSHRIEYPSVCVCMCVYGWDVECVLMSVSVGEFNCIYVSVYIHTSICITEIHCADSLV